MLNLSQIIHHFFRKEELEQVSETELRQFVSLYPYSTAGHLLLVKKLKDAGDERAFEKEINSTAIYFNNPVWLQWLIKGEETPETPVLSQIETHGMHEVTIYENIEDIVNETPGQRVDPSIYSASEDEPEHESYDLKSRDSREEYQGHSGNGHDVSENDHTEIPRESVTETNGDSNEALEEKSVEELQDENLVQGIMNEETPVYTRISEEQETVSTENDQPVDESVIEHPIPEKQETSSDTSYETSQQEFPEHAEDNNDEIQPEAQVVNAEENEQPVIAIHQQHDIIEEQQSSNQQPELITQQPETSTQQPELSIQNSDAISFEPFHTVDYFASQGIKLRQEELNRDKLGQQLKSFTEWLRSMKKVPGQMISTNMDDSVQQSIQRFAEHSVEEKEVLTEAMAEVWAKQGNRLKAVVIYQKLSLQNPDKSAYFAAKIDQLNAL